MTLGDTYADQYMFRLAETYLIRAEAYLGTGDKTKAAEDISAVRSQANASPLIIFCLFPSGRSNAIRMQS